ncbi:MAG: hypothetical protein Q9173_005046 [Seirophora scorigena]
MVCAKCQKQLKSTALATPAVKKKTEMYYGSPAGSTGRIEKASSAGGSTGAGKSKLLSKSAKNPYAQYASSCKTYEEINLILIRTFEGLLGQEQTQQATHSTKSRSYQVTHLSSSRSSESAYRGRTPDPDYQGIKDPDAEFYLLFAQATTMSSIDSEPLSGPALPSQPFAKAT